MRNDSETVVPISVLVMIRSPPILLNALANVLKPEPFGDRPLTIAAFTTIVARIEARPLSTMSITS